MFMISTRVGNNYPNNVGASDDANTQFANFDGAGNSYSIEVLESAGLSQGQPFTFNSVTFNWPTNFSVIPDNYQAAGQTIPITPVPSATTLAFLESAANGASSGTITIIFMDSSTQTFGDWQNPPARAI